MFETTELKALNHLLVDHEITDNVLSHLYQKHPNLDAVLLRSKTLRQIEQVGYISICQENMLSKAENAAFLFAPFILANLNQKVIYTTPKISENNAILNHYFQTDYELSQHKIDDVLSSLNLYIELENNEFSDVEYFYSSLINSLCNSKVSKIICITSLKVDEILLKKLEITFNVEILLVQQDLIKIDFDLSKINLLKLLFKNKDEQYIELCHKYSLINAKLLELLNLFSLKQAAILVEDMFYSEHIFEKLSVYGEYIQTNIQHEKIS
ncbi:hypothetical protein B9T33_11050 [Acinetobacter sp. ANC 5054]|uniref:hypothetical protein n=1 Tax=Acinetobacter sp. ANC 5054 TaxID=1977877 RepID=UPI000A34772B|nr:hypothetical protein [Acinetobacter sp. ANC 5054]OTG79670.1 hypothetical protein B9T33_11050 [Acinetobacter sp. ANC 5054]